MGLHAEPRFAFVVVAGRIGAVSCALVVPEGRELHLAAFFITGWRIGYARAQRCGAGVMKCRHGSRTHLNRRALAVLGGHAAGLRRMGFEVLGGIGLLIPVLSVAAAWGLIALFVAVFPANINMAVNQIAIENVPHQPVLYWVRLPLQAVLIAWAWWYTKHPERQLGFERVMMLTKSWASR